MSTFQALRVVDAGDRKTRCEQQSLGHEDLGEGEVVICSAGVGPDEGVPGGQVGARRLQIAGDLDQGGFRIGEL